MSLADVRCVECGTYMEPRSITAQGSYSACECGRTTMTSLLGGKLEQLEVPPADLGIVRDEVLTLRSSCFLHGDYAGERCPQCPDRGEL